MALTDIITKIGKDAEKEAAAIVAGADKKIREIETESAEAVEVFKGEAATARERASQKASEQVLAGARHHASFTQAEFRNKHIQKVFESVSQKLTSLPENEYAALMKKLLKDVPKKATFTVASEREDETKKVLKELGMDIKDLKVAPKGELLGGCIAVTDESEFDFSFSGMLRALEKTERARAAQELFN